MADSPTKSNPSSDETLAAAITNAICAANLVNEQKLTRIRDGLAKGTLSVKGGVKVDQCGGVKGSVPWGRNSRDFGGRRGSGA